MRRLTALAILLICTTATLAQPPAPDAEQLTKEFRRQAHAMMLDYSFTLPQRPDVEITLIEEPLMNWTNPVAGNWEGVVYLWMAEGRPAVIASPLHHADRRQMAHEFHQLTESPLVGSRNGQVVWDTSESGVTWRPLPDADPPATSAAARKLQMRAFARKFSAEKIGPDDVRRDMRLLPQSVYRTEPGAVLEGDKVIDGSCFLLCQTTDPEVVVLLEARQRGEESTWYYALARLNQHEFFVSYDGNEVQQFPFVPFRNRSDPRVPYTKFYNQLYQDLPEEKELVGGAD